MLASALLREVLGRLMSITGENATALAAVSSLARRHYMQNCREIWQFLSETNGLDEMLGVLAFRCPRRFPWGHLSPNKRHEAISDLLLIFDIPWQTLRKITLLVTEPPYQKWYHDCERQEIPKRAKRKRCADQIQ